MEPHTCSKCIEWFKKRISPRKFLAKNQKSTELISHRESNVQHQTCWYQSDCTEISWRWRCSRTEGFISNKWAIEDVQVTMIRSVKLHMMHLFIKSFINIDGGHISTHFWWILWNMEYIISSPFLIQTNKGKQDMINI